VKRNREDADPSKKKGPRKAAAGAG